MIALEKTSAAELAVSTRDPWTAPEKAALLALLIAALYAAQALPSALRAGGSPERGGVAGVERDVPDSRAEQPLPESAPRWGDLALGGCILLYDSTSDAGPRLAILYATETPNPGVPGPLLEGRRGLTPWVVAADKRILGELWQRWRRAGLLHLPEVAPGGPVTRELALTGGGRTLRLRRGPKAEPAFERAIHELEAALKANAGPR